MHRFTRGALVFILVLSVSGCGVIFGGTRQNITATSSPQGVQVVTAPGTVSYATPTTLSLERKQEYTLTFSMDGYTSQDFRLSRNMRTGILVADILLTGLIGVVVDAATGAWYRLSPENVNLTLTRTAAGPGPATIDIAIGVRDDQVDIQSSAPGVTVTVDEPAY